MLKNRATMTMTVRSHAKKLFISVTSFLEVRIRPPAAYRLHNKYTIELQIGQLKLKRK